MIDPQTILGLGSGIVGAAIQLKKQKEQDQHEMMMASLGLSNNNANDAQKRGSTFGRWFSTIMILSVGFGGLVFAAYNKIPVSQIVEQKPLLDLLGLIKLGGGQRVIEAEGFVIPEYVENSIVTIVYFLFGHSAAKR